MKMRLRGMVIGVVLLNITAAGLAFGAGSALRPAPAHATTVTPCPAGVSPACAGWQDTNTTGVVQDLELLDHNGAPIWWCNNAGGCWVGNDKMGVTGGSVFDLAVYMWSPDGVHGAVVVDGQTLTGADIAYLHRLEKIRPVGVSR